MNFFLKGLYTFFRILVQTTLRLYFRRIVYVNRHFLREKGPLIVIANHPNTLIDPLLAVMHLRERCFFLANYSLFKHPVSNWLLSRLYCIPVKRPSDVPEGAPLANEAAFAQSDAHLKAGGSLFIAIEGTSEPERHLRPFKTGAARIAFSMAHGQDFQTDLRILPIGLTYYDPLNFGSDVVIEVGEPLSLHDWATAYRSNARAAIHDLTATLQEKMSNLVVNCTDADEEVLLRSVETIYQSEQPLATLPAHQRSKVLLAQLRRLQDQAPSVYAQLKTAVAAYFDYLAAKQLSDVGSKVTFTGRLWVILITAPVWFWGLMANGLPAFICQTAVKKLGIDRGYDTTVRYLLGLFAFPIYWFMLLKIGNYATLYAYLPWYVYFLTFIPTGLYAFWVGQQLRAYRNVQRFKRLPAAAQRQKWRQTLLVFLETSILPFSP